MTSPTLVGCLVVTAAVGMDLKRMRNVIAELDKGRAGRTEALAEDLPCLLAQLSGWACDRA